MPHHEKKGLHTTLVGRSRLAEAGRVVRFEAGARQASAIDGAIREEGERIGRILRRAQPPDRDDEPQAVR